MTRTRWASTIVALVAGALVATSGIHAQEAETTENQPRDSEATRRDESSTTRQAQEDQNQSERERAQREQREQSERQRREREQREQQDPRAARSQEDTRTQEDQARSRRFDEDPRERDRSFSRYPDDPRAPEARDRRAADAQRDPRAGRDEQAREGAWLGVYLAENQQQNGALVRSVYPAGPAARAGFRSGDIIVSVDGQRVSDASEVTRLVERMDPRAQAEFVVLRGGQQVALNTTLGDRQAFVVQQEEFGGRQQSGRRYSNQPEEQDDFASVPPYAMELEHHRRMAEQHQRLEEAIDRLHEEVRQLREELRSTRGTDSGRRQ